MASSSSSIPLIWRNLSLKRRRPTSVAAVELAEGSRSTSVGTFGSFSVNSLGTRFSEDFNANYNEALVVHVQAPAGAKQVKFVANPDTRRDPNYSPPRPPSPFVVRPGTPADHSHASGVETSYFKFQERAVITEALSVWSTELEKIRADYETPFRALFGPCQRFFFPQYRKLLAAVTDCQKLLNKLLDLLRTADDHPDVVFGMCQDLTDSLRRWSERAARRYGDMTDGQGRQFVVEGMYWKTVSRRKSALLEAGPALAELAEDLRVGARRRVSDIVELLVEEKQRVVLEVPAGRPVYRT